MQLRGLLLLLFVALSTTAAGEDWRSKIFELKQSGCCSSHGGETSACAYNGHVICADGTASPSCLCQAPPPPPPPPPAQGILSVASTLTLGSTPVGSTDRSGLVAISNVGAASVTLYGISSNDAPEFQLNTSTCGGVIGIGSGCSFTVAFTPVAVGLRAAVFTISSSGSGSPQAVRVSGTGSQIATPPPGSSVVEVIEYHYPAFDHYFMTGIADEISKLDAGAFPGWVRTGYQFNAYATGAVGGSAVCRFFSTSFAPRSSHFYTPSPTECGIVKGNPDWSYEGNVFSVPVPDANGTCPITTLPVYRLYNNGQGGAPNHRYTTNADVRAQMIAGGWIPEGYGPNGVVMCSP
jgi:hypothetical protein